MVSTGDIIQVLGTTAPAGDLMSATYQAAKAKGFTDEEARYLAQLDAVDEARSQGAPAFVVSGLQQQAQDYLAANEANLTNLLNNTSTPTPEQSVAQPTPSPYPTGVSPVNSPTAPIIDPLAPTNDVEGEYNLGYGSEYLPLAMQQYTDLVRIGTNRELTLEELAYKREVESRLKREFEQQLGLQQGALDLDNRRFEETIRQYDLGLQFQRDEAARQQGNIVADRNLDVAARLAGLRANPLSAAESVLYQDQIQGLGPSGQGIYSLLAQAAGLGPVSPGVAGAMGDSSPAPAGMVTGGGTPAQNRYAAAGLNTQIDTQNFVRNATQGAGGNIAVGLGGLDVKLPKTLSGGEMSQMSDTALGVYDSFSAAGGNPNAIARSARALVPAAFQGVGAGV